VRRWRRHLAAERAEAKTYRSLAEQRDGEEREILLALAEAEARHEAHWLGLLGDAADAPGRVDVRTRLLGWLARRFGSVFILALVQRAEARSPFHTDADATAAMAADEQIHAEVVRGLAAEVAPGQVAVVDLVQVADTVDGDGLAALLELIAAVRRAGGRVAIAARGNLARRLRFVGVERLAPVRDSAALALVAVKPS
jgi:ABC-type transporter Mla MlaB component